MKNALATIVAVLVCAALVFGVIWGVRLFSSATVSVVVVEPEPGIKCAKLVAGDGVAIDCWEVP